MNSVNPASFRSPAELAKAMKEMSDIRGVKMEDVKSVVQEAVISAAKKIVGNLKIRVDVNINTGDVAIFRASVIRSDKPERTDSEYTLAEDGERVKIMSLQEAQFKFPGHTDGDIVYEPLDIDITAIASSDLSRRLARGAKRVLEGRVTEILRAKQFQEFHPMIGQVISVVVKGISVNGATLELGGNEMFLPRRFMIGGDRFKSGDRIKVCIKEVISVQHGPQIIVSRTCEEFLIELMKREIPEIYSGAIEVKTAVRIPGERAKVVVISKDKAMNAVAACVGIKGSRLASIKNELCGERIDVIEHKEDPIVLLRSALAPATVTKIIVEEEANRVLVGVAPETIGMAIGREGSNVRLLSKLLEMQVDIVTHQESEDYAKDVPNQRAKELATILEIEEDMAKSLVSYGVTNFSLLALARADELSAIPGITEEIATTLIEAAKKLAEAAAASEYESENESVSLMLRDLLIVAGLENDAIDALIAGGIISVNDLADADTDEILSYLQAANLSMSEDSVGELILCARKSVGMIQQSSESHTDGNNEEI